jgi:2-polyprenyl-3-methyl-5-hydroxy-6-metoxy-1,4-benzoquinol methylase
MSATDNIIAEEMTRQTEAFLDRILESTAGAFNIFTMYIGDRLGFYRALAEGGPSTCAELAARTGTNERYAREWLEQQTVAGILAVEDVDIAPEARRFSLPPAHAEALVESDSLNYLAPLARMVVAAGHPMESILKAYRNGGGVPYREYGAEFREGQAEINRAMFLKQLGTEYIPSIPDIHTRLQSDPPARIADIGCGAGWSSIGMASAYPKVRVDGYDLDQPSITLAQANAKAAGLNGRVKFQVRDAGDPTLAGRYDLVTAFECVHDMSEPVKALKTMFNLAAENGAVVVMDERVGDSFTAKGNEVEWMMYGWSVLHCLPVGMADQPSVATGTVMRTDTLRKYAEQAGFCDIEILPIDNFFFRFYRLKTICTA